MSSGVPQLQQLRRMDREGGISGDKQRKEVGPETLVITTFLSSSRSSSSDSTPTRHATHFTDQNPRLCGSGKAQGCVSHPSAAERLGNCPAPPTRGHPSLAAEGLQCHPGAKPSSSRSLPGLMDANCGFSGSSLLGFFILQAASLRVLSTPCCTIPVWPAAAIPTC